MSETVGFSGTRRTLTFAECARVREIIMAIPRGTRIITGACVGVDAYVARVAYSNGYTVHTIVPADRSRVDRRFLDFCTTWECLPKGTTYRDRNQRIVLESDRLIAIPDHDEDAPESRRSGTWQTVRMSRKTGRPTDVHILCADCDPSRPAPDRQPGGTP